MFIAVIGSSVKIIMFRSIGLGIIEVMLPEMSYQPVVNAFCCFPISQKIRFSCGPSISLEHTRERAAKWLRVPLWSEQELQEMGYGISRQIRRALMLRSIYITKLRRSTLLGYDPDSDSNAIKNSGLTVIVRGDPEPSSLKLVKRVGSRDERTSRYKPGRVKTEFYAASY